MTSGSRRLATRSAPETPPAWRIVAGCRFNPLLFREWRSPSAGVCSRCSRTTNRGLTRSRTIRLPVNLMDSMHIELTPTQQEILLRGLKFVRSAVALAIERGIVHLVQLRVADAAGIELDGHLVGPGIPQLDFLEAQRAPDLGLHGGNGFHLSGGLVSGCTEPSIASVPLKTYVVQL